eukprot:TRINITY_DN83688_c0_g1_i1.p1 TRINITY_DN83688_c0_g1~~TRINITY_DN83688_c0_g1_i1.p1  ORF type:complete len:223 (+),score=51.44 TRINITY_DN83688_c0_g1_i1:43-669(+)
MARLSCGALRRWLAALVAAAAFTSAVGECDGFSPETLSKLARWFEGELSAEDVQLECVLKQAAGAAGVAGAAYVGSQLGGSIGGQLGEMIGGIFDAGDSGRQLGEQLGAALGLGAGLEVGRYIFKENLFTFINNRSPEGMLRECHELMSFGEYGPQEASEITRAYREKAKQFHPDRGGTEEQMVKLNLCKELEELHLSKKTSGTRGEL